MPDTRPPETYLSLIRQGARTLEAAGVDAPMREARLIVALAADKNTAALIGAERDVITDPMLLQRFGLLLQRRAAREPFAHLAGRRSFYGLDLKSDMRALIPRSDSEILVERALELLPRGDGKRIVDLGTGSGCLLAAILKECSGAHGVGVEADPAAAGLARENLQRHGLLERAELCVMSWQDWTGWSGVDLVLSNPPYIRSSVISTLAPEVRNHDPLHALDGGRDGLDAYREIIPLAAAGMRMDVPLLLEIGFDQAADVSGLLAFHGFSAIEVTSDLSGHQRVVTSRAPGAKPGE